MLSEIWLKLDSIVNWPQSLTDLHSQKKNNKDVIRSTLLTVNMDVTEVSVYSFIFLG